jgi:hypothetical protein
MLEYILLEIFFNVSPAHPPFFMEKGSKAGTIHVGQVSVVSLEYSVIPPHNCSVFMKPVNTLNYLISSWVFSFIFQTK